MKKDASSLTLTIKATTPEAAERLFKALGMALTPAEKAAFLKQLDNKLAKLASHSTEGK